MNKKRSILNLILTLSLLIGTFANAQPAHALTLNVTNLNDSGAGSLRQAIADAVSGDTITFSVTGTITLTSGHLPISNKDLTITGPGSALLTIDGNNASRIFLTGGNNSNTVLISGMKMTHGYVNPVDGCGGGGIYNASTFLTLDDVVITDNDSQDVDNANCLFPRGGGIYSSTDGSLTMTNSVVSNNFTYYGGGGIYFYSSNGTLSLTNVIVTDNQVTNSGSGGGVEFVGGSAPAILDKVTISNNSTLIGSGESGGGIDIQGDMFITNSSIINNSTHIGGGVSVYDASSVEITNSLIAGNTSQLGGGVYVSISTLALKNVTITGNNATSNSTSGGGGVHVADISGFSTLNINNSTIAGNTASAGYVGGIQVRPLAANVVNVSNTILADNTSANGTVNDDCEGLLNSLDYNLFENVPGTCSITGAGLHDIVSLDPALSALADNGGLTQTLGLPVFSPAVNAGKNATCQTTDQRGVSRPIGGLCDMGAFEYTASSIVITTSETGEGSLPIAVGFSPADTTITFAPALAGQTILLTQRIDLSQNVTIDGAGLATPVNVSGGDATQIFQVDSGVVARIKNIALIHGKSATHGGAISNAGNLQLTNVDFSSNTALGYGGALYNTNRLNITGGSFVYNSAFDSLTDFNTPSSWNYGGAIADFNGTSMIISGTTFGNNNAEEIGGAIYCENDNAVSIETSTFSANETGFEGGALNIFTGCVVTIDQSTFDHNLANSAGAIYNGNSLTATNTTFYANSANLNGAGVYNDATFISKNNTFSANSAGNEGSGIYSQGSFQLYNTLLANSAGGLDCYKNGGTLTNNVNNLIEFNAGGVNACGVQALTVDPMLDVFALNGGTTMNFSLLPGSPAINAGDDATCSSIDQRGIDRPQPIGGSCDIGSFEQTSTPFVSSIVRVTPSLTNASSVSFTVTFSESVTGVDLSDFSLTTTGVSSAAVSGISGTGSSYTVTVNTGSGSGTLRLDLTDDDTIKEIGFNSLGGAGLTNGNFISGETYTLDRTSPSVSTSTRVHANPTNLPSVDFTVTFSESVTGVDLSDFSLTTTGVSSPAVSGISGTGSSYTVTVNTGSGSGTIRLNVLDDNSIIDAASNSLSAGFTSGQVYTVSKLPASATFSDVSTNYWAWSYIERLFNAGITGGCSTVPLNYCPDSTVTRAQMAVFLLKSMHGSSFVPPAIGASTGFGDVATNYWAAAWIKQLAAEGITGGCGGGNYCPDNTVTRAQMAVFLLKAKNGSSYSPPAVGVSTGFNDVAIDYWAAAFIKQLVADGITSGCGNSNYCPDAEVTRAQMAVFLVKAFNLP